MSIYEQLKEAGIDITVNYQSDLYVKVCPITIKLISKYEYRNGVSIFTCNVTGEPFYDIPFAYDPWWEEKSKCLTKK